MRKKPVSQPIARPSAPRALVAKTAAFAALPTAAFFAAALALATTSVGCRRDEDARADVTLRRPARKTTTEAAVAPTAEPVPAAPTAPTAPSAQPTPGGSPETIEILPTPAVVIPTGKPVTKSKAAPKPPIHPTPVPMPMGGDMAVVYPM